MKTTKDAIRRSVQRLVRLCDCEYQKQKAWGYNLQQWVGGRKSWKEIGNATHPEDVEKYAQRFDTVLIRCNGCGADIVREYPPNSLIADLKRRKETAWAEYVRLYYNPNPPAKIREAWEKWRDLAREYEAAQSAIEKLTDAGGETRKDSR